LGLGTLAFSPLAMGVLTGKYAKVDDIPENSRGAGPSFAFFNEDDTWQDMPFFTQPTLDAVQQLKPLAKALDCSLAQLALAWVLHQPGITAVLTGASRISQLEDNAAAADLELSPAILSGITNALREVIDYEAPTAPNMES
jgi:aryl-alcohol dehydrogenase-like predicted oxidoreductase